MEQTLILLKPDAVQRRLAGRIIGRFESKGLKIVAMKMIHVDKATAGRMYAVHEGKSFYEALVRFMTARPVVAMVIEGLEAVAVCRRLIGATNCAEAVGGTIRGDLGLSTRHNLVHGSDSVESARREIPVFFQAGEILAYDLADDGWVYADAGGKTI